MNRQTTIAIKMHLRSAAFLLVLLFLVIQVIPRAVAQRNSRKRSVAADMSQFAGPLTGATPGMPGATSSLRARSDGPTRLASQLGKASTRGGGVQPATAGCGLLVGDGLTIGFVPNNYTQLASNIVNYTFVNSQTATNDFALFETHDPWGYTVLKDAISGNGHTYTEFTPAQLAGFDFSQYRVVILNWDDTGTDDFDADYEAAIPALEAYVSAGGVVWVQGAIQDYQGVDSYSLPFGGTSTWDPSPSDPIVDPASPMVAGVPSPIVGNNASHVSDYFLPANAHVVVVNGNDQNPVLYELWAGANCGPTPTPTPTPTPEPCEFRVVIVYADDAGGFPAQLQSEILAEPGVTAVGLLDGQHGTPTLAQLQLYNIVAAYSTYPFADDATLGNNLADYVDGGGIVVQYGLSFYGPNQPYGVNGRWVSDNYNPYDYSTNLVQQAAFTLGAFDAGHPLMAGVTTLNSNYGNIVTPAQGATEVAAASNGNSLVAFRPVSGGHTTVGVTAFVGIAADQSGDWGKVIVNAGRWLLGCAPTPTPTPTPIRLTPTPRPRPTPALRPTPH